MSAVGEIPGSVDALYALPVGTILCYAEDVSQESPYNTWRKVEGDAWKYYIDGRPAGGDQLVGRDSAHESQNLSRWTIHTMGVNPNYVIREDAEIPW